MARNRYNIYGYKSANDYLDQNHNVPAAGYTSKKKALEVAQGFLTDFKFVMVIGDDEVIVKVLPFTPAEKDREPTTVEVGMEIHSPSTKTVWCVRNVTKLYAHLEFLTADRDDLIKEPLINITKNVEAGKWILVKPENKYNPSYGYKDNFASKREEGFKYKDAKDYSLKEWLENMFLLPSDNASHPTFVYIMDKRSGERYSQMHMSLTKGQRRELRISEETAKAFLTDYWYNVNGSQLKWFL